MQDEQQATRCRLVLIAPDDVEASRLIAACEGGDVASVILPRWGREAGAFQAYCEDAVPALQALGIAVLIEGDSRIAGRVHADGLHLEGKAEEVAESVERARGRMIVGANGGRTRHEALETGEAQPDYVLFGRIGYDREAVPHPRNLSLGRWWAEMVEIPCIVQGGATAASVAAVAATGAEFVALSAAVFGPGIEPREAVAEANRLLEAAAPRFEAAP